MSILSNTFNLYQRGFSALGSFAFSPMPFTFFTLPFSGFFLAPALVASFLPVILFASVLTCAACCFGDRYDYGRQPYQTTVVHRPWYSSWGGMFDWFGPSTAYSGPTTSYSSAPHGPYTGRTSSTSVWQRPSSSSYSQPPSAYTAPSGSGIFSSGQHVASHHHASAPSMPHSQPTYGGSSQVVMP